MPSRRPAEAAAIGVDGCELDPGCHLLNPFPLVNMAAIGGMLVPWILTGGKLVLHHPLTLPVFLGQIQAEKINYTVVPPALLNMLLANAAILSQVDISSIKNIGSGSAPLSPLMVLQYQEKYNIRVINLSLSSTVAESCKTDPLDAASKPKQATVNLFYGPDPGQGLDLSGTFPYAISFGSGDPGGQIHDAIFTSDDVEGFTVVSSQVANNWNVDVNFGDSFEQQILSSVMAGIRWSNADNPTTADVTATFTALEIGAPYKLQLLFGERLWARGFNISIGGKLVAREFAPFQWQGGFVGPGGATPRTNGVVVTYSFIANRTELTVVLDGRPVRDPAMADHNAIINGATLELVAAAVDSDADGLWDAWEMENFGNLNQTSNGDPDGDALTNAQEFGAGTDPNKADTDGDAERCGVLNEPFDEGKNLWLTRRRCGHGHLSRGGFVRLHVNGLPRQCRTLPVCLRRSTVPFPFCSPSSIS